MNQTVETYPVVNYSPRNYIPIDVLQQQWAKANEDGADIVDNPHNEDSGFSDVSAFIAAATPLTLMISLALIVVSSSSVKAMKPHAGLGDFLANPLMLLSLIVFTISITNIFKRVRYAAKHKNSIDFAVMESARRYLKLRYGFLPANWEHRFVSYLVGEDVPDNLLSTDYQLTVRNFKGHQVLMISNLDGEAPVKC